MVAEAKRIARVREALPACSHRGWFKAVDLLFSLPHARNRVQSGLLRAISRDTFGQHMTIGLKIGDLALDFKATAVGGIYGGGQEVKLADFAGSTLVLYFYPKDGTPGCTAQACELRDSWGELQSKVELFGISGDSVESHQKFIKKHGLPFPLLSDPDHEIVKAYQVWAEKSMHGKK